jgi:Na+-translocating ferredoxin:NAD+ oxidoreductase RNF subunit RnfB
MGHIQGKRSSLVPLIDRLNRYPIGLPDSEKLRKILSILFSEDEAYVASRFPLTEATFRELARATGWPPEKLANTLEEMCQKGLVIDTDYGGRTYYVLMPGLIGFFEFTFMKRREDLPVPELAQLMHEYLFEDPEKKMTGEFFGSRTPLTRALAYEEHVPVSTRVETYETACRIVENSDYGAIGMCYCRHKKEHLQKSCERKAPVDEICISLGSAAKFMVRRGFAEYRTSEQLLAVLKKAKEFNLTHVTDNIRHKPSFICNCCSCCCELLGGVQQGFPMGIAKAGFSLVVDPASCAGCGLCAKACNVKALMLESHGETPEKFKVKVSARSCLGCGACISSCPTGSLSLIPVGRAEIPENKRILFQKILKEKKRLTPFVVDTVKKGVREKLGMR